MPLAPARSPLRLSVLDQSPIAEDATAADALRNTLDLARLADELGFHRYWLAEHHASHSLAGVAPEALIGPVALATRRIRVGSGGVMLPHYSPFKVAETFAMLASLAPGRVDLGIGRAPGSDGRTAYALQRDRSRTMPIDDFPGSLAELLGYYDRALPEEHPFAKLSDTLPLTGAAPDIWLLGTSADSAALAGTLGLPYCIADFINSDAVPLADLYRRNFRPSGRCAEPELAVACWAIAAEDRAAAERFAMPAAMMFAHLMRGQTIAVPSVERAEAWLRDNPMPSRRRRSLLGSGAEVRAQVEEVAELHGAGEVFLVNILPDHEARRDSYRRVAAAFVSSEEAVESMLS